MPYVITCQKSYEDFSSKQPDQGADLCFPSERSRWVAGETWHPNQKGRYDGEH
jgi:hypothetical protein